MSSLQDMGKAIERALDEENINDVLGVLTGAFVGLTIELVRRQGADASKEITLSGGQERDITIHAAKAEGA